MDKNQDLYVCIQDTHFRLKDTQILKVKGWKKILHANGKEKKAGVAILISDKIDFKTKNCNKGQRMALHNDKDNNQQEDRTLINIYAPNIGARKYTKQLLTDIKGEIDSNTIIGQ